MQAAALAGSIENKRRKAEDLDEFLKAGLLDIKAHIERGDGTGAINQIMFIGGILVGLRRLTTDEFILIIAQRGN